MRIGQTVTYTDEHGTASDATILVVNGPDTPGPRILDLRVGEETVSAVKHADVAAEGEPHWVVKPK